MANSALRQLFDKTKEWDFEATERAVQNLHDDCHKPPVEKRYSEFSLDSFPEAVREAILNEELSADEIQVVTKILQLLEERLDRMRFPELYIEVVRTLFIIATEETLRDEDGKVQTAFKRLFIVKWVNLCLSSDPSHAHFDPNVRIYFGVHEIDAEAEIRQIMLEKENLTLFDERRRRFYLQNLLHWFLRRYDLSTAGELLKYMPPPSPQSSSFTRFWQIWSWKTTTFAAATVTFMFFLISRFPKLSLKHEVVTPMINSWPAMTRSPSEVDLFTTFLCILYFAGLVTAIAMLFAPLRRKCQPFNRIKLLTPRMAGGIVVGYLPLLIGDECWRAIHQLSELQGVLLFFAAMLFAGSYLFLEVNNALMNSAKALARATRLLCLGLWQSFVFGIIILDLMTEPFLHDTLLYKEIYSYLDPGLFGVLYPKMLVLYFPLAVVIGIFVQIIWEDKPVTQPL